MTVNALIKKLQKLQKGGCGRHRIGVNKESLWDGNGTFVICDVSEVYEESVNVCDGDGFGIENKDGSERTRWQVILSDEKKGVC